MPSREFLYSRYILLRHRFTRRSTHWDFWKIIDTSQSYLCHFVWSSFFSSINFLNGTRTIGKCHSSFSRLFEFNIVRHFCFIIQIWLIGSREVRSIFFLQRFIFLLKWLVFIDPQPLELIYVETSIQCWSAFFRWRREIFFFANRRKFFDWTCQKNNVK